MSVCAGRKRLIDTSARRATHVPIGPEAVSGRHENTAAKIAGTTLAAGPGRALRWHKLAKGAHVTRPTPTGWICLMFGAHLVGCTEARIAEEPFSAVRPSTSTPDPTPAHPNPTRGAGGSRAPSTPPHPGSVPGYGGQAAPSQPPKGIGCTTACSTRSVCREGRCTCPSQGACVGKCVEISDDAGTDTCSAEGRELPSGCAAEGCPEIVAITAGDFHTCIVLADRRIMCWGMNTLSENNSTIAKKNDPEIVDGFSDIEVYAAGRAHSCFVTTGGPAQCFGINYYGELGNGTKDSSATPVEVRLDRRAIAFGLGEMHSCAVLDDGSVQCWGAGDFGELGDGRASESARPQPVPGLSGVQAISARVSHTCVLLSDRSVECWGASRIWTGSNTPMPDLTVEGAPRKVAGLGPATNIATGELHACALLEDGTVQCWGANGAGQLGRLDPTERAEPSRVANLRDVKAIAAGNDSNCAIVGDGTVHCWGDNRAGQLGDGITAPSAYPVQVVNVENARLVAAGGYHYCAVTKDNSVRCWGAGRDRQLGNGILADSNIPVAVQFPPP